MNEVEDQDHEERFSPLTGLDIQDDEHLNVGDERVSTNDSNENRFDDLEDPTMRALSDLQDQDIEAREPPQSLHINNSHLKANSSARQMINQNRNNKVIDSMWRCTVHLGFWLSIFIYHTFTTFFFLAESLLLSCVIISFISGILDLNLAIWLFVTLTMAFLVTKLCLQHLFPEVADLHDLFHGDYRTGREQIQDVIIPRQPHVRSQPLSASRLPTRGVRYPQMDSHIRRNQSSILGRDLFSRSRWRSHRPGEFMWVDDSIQMSEIRPRREPPPSQVPRVRLRFNTALTVDEMRRMREDRLRDGLRTEVLESILSRLNHNRGQGVIHRDREISSQLLLLRANLQMLQLQSMGAAREFNDMDYDMLSSLDQYHNRQQSERISSIVGQLPTYQYQSKSSQPIDQDEPGIISNTCNANCNNNFMISQCSICIEQFEDEDMIKILPCFHQFHAKCADDWLLRKSVCPVCKFDIDVSEEQILNQQAIESNQQ